MEWNDTLEVIPNGVQTESKMPNRHVEGVYPKYIVSGHGAWVTDENGEEYVDFPCSLGANLLGHAYPSVVQAVKDQLLQGTLFSLPHPSETLLAQKLRDLIPCAEMTRFVKTGSEADTAAVRIARAYTKRNTILCCGYHGWHDWYNLTTPRHAGVLPTKGQKPSVIQFKYNDYEAFKKLLIANRKTCAAVIMEPYILAMPEDNFLEKVKTLCDRYNTLLIFDEVITGFRTPGLSAQKHYGITPDMCTIGKALGNGIAVGAVCGRKDIMSVLKDDCFVSSTFGGELLGIAAALAVLEVLTTEPVVKNIWNAGTRLTEVFRSAADGLDGVECIGLPCRTFFNFPTEAHKSLFWQAALRTKVFFGYAQFTNYSHGQIEMDQAFEAIKKGIYIVRKYWDDPEKGLQGEVAQATHRMISVK